MSSGSTIRKLSMYKENTAKMHWSSMPMATSLCCTHRALTPSLSYLGVSNFRRMEMATTYTLLHARTAPLAEDGQGRGGAKVAPHVRENPLPHRSEVGGVVLRPLSQSLIFSVYEPETKIIRKRIVSSAKARWVLVAALHAHEGVCRHGDGAVAAVELYLALVPDLPSL
jgi:hypothetical protein